MTPLRKRCFVSTCRNYAAPGDSRCAEHRRSNWSSFKPAHRDVYRTRRWTDLRAKVLREEPTCCVEGCEARSTAVDHVTQLAQGGAPYDRSNLRGMCYAHHAKRSSQQGAEAKKKRRRQPPP